MKDEPYELLYSPPDYKNIELAKTLLSLRGDLDIHCLIGVNASAIGAKSVGRLFFAQVDMRAVQSIVLAICKIYEPEKSPYELNSIQGVLNSLAKEKVVSEIDRTRVRKFVSRYGGPTDQPDLVKALQLTFDAVRQKFGDDLDRFKAARDKLIAHSEYRVQITSVPSFATMESLFEFGADFYEVVGECFIGYSVDELKNRREVKRDLVKILRLIGLEHVETEMK
jgi:hypothetical protein